MRAGDLRHRITLEAATEVRGDGGTVTTKWTPIPGASNIPCSIEALDGTEALRGMQLQARVTHRLRLRWRAGVTAKLRARQSARVFHIQRVTDPGERRAELVLLAEEVVG